MRLSTLARTLGALCLAGSLTYAAAGSADASTPNWSMSVTDLPATVSNGSGAGYSVTISNAGPSNISQLYLVTKTTDSPAYVTTTQGTCSAPGSGPLVCSFGALNAGQSVTVVAGYVTPASGTSYDPVFQVNSNGATYSDSKGRSHGDTLQDPNETPTQLTSSGDFGGGFSFDTGTVQDNQSLSKKNIQATSVTPPTGDIIATVQDGLGSSAYTCTGCTGTLFGDWSRVTVSHGETFGSLFPVTLMVYGKQVPTGVTAADIVLVHVLDDGTTQILSTPCGTTVTANCIDVSQVGGNYKITGWVDQNGGFKGMG